MNQSIKKQWVKALRSGKYEQGTGGWLRSGKQYCCLGVLVAECGGESDIEMALLDECDLEKFGFEHAVEMTLANLNDAGVPFEMIAGLIDHAL